MAKLTKNQKAAAAKIEAGKAYTLSEATALVKEITYTKFDASVDIDIRLGVDPRKANQMVRGTASLPNGTGKVVRHHAYVSHLAPHKTTKQKKHLAKATTVHKTDYKRIKFLIVK